MRENGWRWAALVFVVLIVGCPRRDDDETDGGSRVPDSGPTPIDAAGPPPPPPDAGPSSETTMATAALVRAVGTAVAIAGPLVADGEALRDGPTGLDSRETTTRDRIENGVSGNSVVTDPACTTFDWSGLSVTVTFAGCVLEATGESLDGSVRLRVAFAPTAIGISFEALTVGSSSIDGTLELLLGGSCAAGDPTCTQCRDVDATCMARTQAQRTLQGDVTVAAAGGAPVSVSLTATVEHDASGTRATGSGTLESSALDGSFTATDLLWAMGDCLPSSGTLVLDDGSSSLTNPATVGFLAVTPTDGTVSLRLGALPAAEVMLLEPCP
ncbi:MAG: hypothetical protein IT379_42990 [Deltaproteobacteria bacterium]|nr:hypothetical protein [Deltaproteobacteria bacterium]